MAEMNPNHENIIDLKERIKTAEEEIENLRHELMETNTGIIALYNELNDTNEKLKQKNEELQNTLKELRETQDKLIQSEKMAAIGSIIVTYNHQINNPLMIILGNVQFVLMTEKNLDENLNKRLKIVESECWRISEVTSKIKQYEKLIPVKYLNTMFEFNISDRSNNENGNNE